MKNEKNKTRKDGLRPQIQKKEGSKPHEHARKRICESKGPSGSPASEKKSQQ